ncbi:MAG: ParA family protein [Candidatus Izemoplasmatales bacterium]|jgi:chromosome partitioning protein|nr:ParA family protein [bacterium]MDZ4196934.1 ParA family protein [Candidatus Izemoplasmatales bacterium]
MGLILSIANQKGGVGKTTTAINLASSLSYLERKVLLIDLDYQANATTCLGIHRGSFEYSVFDCLTEETTLQQTILKTDNPLIDVLPARTMVEGVEEKIILNNNRDFILTIQMKAIKEMYDYILIDCPPSLGYITINAMMASDGIIIPVQCEFLAMDGLTQLLNTIRLVQSKKKVNMETLTIFGVLLTMLDTRSTSGYQVIAEVKTYFNEKVFQTVIPRNVSCSNATFYGVPVTEFSPKSKSSLSYRQLAKEVISRHEQTTIR